MLLWRHMTVLEHVKMARYSKLTYGLAGAFFGTPLRHREGTTILLEDPEVTKAYLGG